MQPPSEADIVSATDSLRRQKLAADGQIIALLKIAGILDGMEVVPNDKAHGLFGALSSFARSYADGLSETSYSLAMAIQHNDRALQAYRSGILIPDLTPTQRLR